MLGNGKFLVMHAAPTSPSPLFFYILKYLRQGAEKKKKICMNDSLAITQNEASCYQCQ